MSSENRHPVWYVYDEYRTARMNVRYYERRLSKFARWNLVLEIAGAISVPTIAGLWLWKTTLGNIFWQFILAITAISTVIKPTLKLGDKILQNTEVLTKWRMLDNQFQKLTISISQEKAYDEKSKREFGRLLDVKASIQEPTDKLDKSLRNECFGMVKKELPFENFFVPEE